MNLSLGTILVGTLFGGIGFAAFIYGKKQALLKPMVLGVVLMVYPYLFANVYAQIAIGVVLTALLFIEF